MMNVREMVLSMSMPMSAAVGASSAMARMLRPSLVPRDQPVEEDHHEHAPSR